MASQERWYPTATSMRPALVQRAGQLFTSVAQQGRGRTVFVAGQPGSGRTTLLAQLADALQEAHPKPVIVGGQFAAGTYRPWGAIEDVKPPTREIIALIGASLPLAVAGPLYGSVLALAGQVLQASVAARQLADKSQRTASAGVGSPLSLRTLLRSAAERGPVVCLLDDVDDADPWWANFLLTLTRESVAELPLLLIASHEGPTTLGTEQDDESSWAWMARKLQQEGMRKLNDENGFVEWWPLEPLQSDQIRDWIGAARADVVRRLHDATGGHPELVVHLWTEWQRRGAVRLVDDGRRERWQPVPGLAKHVLPAARDIRDEHLRRLMPHSDVRTIDRVRTMLDCAALEGRRFTAEAVAQAVGWGRDELLEFFEDALAVDEERRDGLVTEIGYVTIDDPRGGARYLWHFEFTSALYRLLGTRDPQVSLDLARALAELYAPDERQVARTLARLFAAGGDRAAARRYRIMADFSTDVAVLRWLAQQTMETDKAEWTRWDYLRGTRLLLETGGKMMRAYPLRETLAMYEAAHEMARHTGAQGDQSTALSRRAWLHIGLGEYDRAGGLLRDALALDRALGDRDGEASDWHQLGTIDLEQGDYAAAREKLERALQLERALGDRAGQADTLHQLGKVDFHQGDYGGARAKSERALQLERALGNRAGQANLLHQLGAIEHRLGDHAKARASTEESLALHQELGDRVGEAGDWHQLGTIDFEEGRYDSARASAERSLAIKQELDHRSDQAVTWHQLGTIDLEQGDSAAARENLERALQLEQALGDRAGEAGTLHQLGFLALKTKGVEDALQLVMLAAIIGQHGDHADGTVLSASLGTLSSQLGLSPEQLESLRRAVWQHYQNDRGWSLIHEALGSDRQDESTGSGP